MNPELKQRLIGAAVVTALATIFIPMLFDDTVDNKGQSVSELTIPAAPIKSTEVSANKLPTPASKNLNKPETPPQEPSDTEDDPSEPVVDAEIVDDAEAEAAASGSATSQVDAGPAVNEPEEDIPSEPLDTGVVAEAKPLVKKPISSVQTSVEPSIKKIDAHPSKPLPATKSTTTPTKLLPVTKPVTAPLVATVKQPVTPKLTVKPATIAPVNAAEKTAKSPELVRWTIHAGSFGKKDNATALMKTLREQGIPVSIETVQSGKGPLYRLKVGPELDKKKAAANKAKLDKQGVDNVLIAE